MTNQEQNPLKYHYSNPKFDGLPWGIENNQKKTFRPKLKKCVKKVFIRQDVDAEIEMLRRDFPALKWWTKFCGVCNGWHVCREGSSYVRGT